MTFWEGLTELALYDWARKHQLVTAAIEGAHIASSAFFVGAIALLDLRVMGLGRKLIVPKFAHHTLAIGLIAFVFVTLTGLFMFGASAPKWLNTPQFNIKMILIALAGVNAAVFHLSIWRSVDVWGAAGKSTPTMAKVFAFGSLGVWIAVIILGRSLGYVAQIPDPSQAEIDLQTQQGGAFDIF